ncbi:hypothetical protein C6P40_003686 [Pichia californica]|uniref:Hap4 transcription factor heteromerisation domain-containing protein n=1 Tax=Pichia californica TaxID=460514 RepID=A0A9P6WIX3_9ASCO|nr:hypothetical protein C6P42_003412 [[Candida] californica]KAG0686618.1 hypothetical protein C6P40_003686 [[Candida] californica]
MIEVDCSIIHNPIKTEILKINEENYYLKLEVIRLVSNLKSLRDEIQPIVDKRKLKSNKTSKKGSMNNKSSAPTPTPTTAPIPPTLSIPTTSQSLTPIVKTTEIVTNINATAIATANTQSTLKSPISDAKLISSSQPKSIVEPLVKSNNNIITTTRNKKRSHDDDINDLILSLIDLSHSHQTSNPKLVVNNNIITNNTNLNTDNATSAASMITTKILEDDATMNEQNIITNNDTINNGNHSKNICDDDNDIENKNENYNGGNVDYVDKYKNNANDFNDKNDNNKKNNFNAENCDNNYIKRSSPTEAVIETDIDLKSLSVKKPFVSISGKIQSPLSNNEIIMSDPLYDFPSKSLLEKPNTYDEDDIDLLSTVSTTPSTMFSLSLSATNETVDSLAGSAVLTNGLDNIGEIPPFELLDLPDDASISKGKLFNYNIPNNRYFSFNKVPILNTYSIIEENFNGEIINTSNINSNNDNEINNSKTASISSLELFNPEDKQNSEKFFNDSVNNMYNNDMVDFSMPEDVDIEFENFINGKNFDF